MFRVVAAVLHLGNVQFTEDSKESANLADEKDPDGRSNGTTLHHTHARCVGVDDG